MIRLLSVFVLLAHASACAIAGGNSARPTAAAAVAQTSPESPRVAAVRFAFANGYDVAGGAGIVVMRESVFPRTPTPPPRNLTQMELQREAEQIAAIVHGSVATVDGPDLFVCAERSPQICGARSTQAVLWVSEPSTTSTGANIHIRLYLPSAPASSGDTRSAVFVHGLVGIQQRTGGWVGTGNDTGPTHTTVRVPR